MFRKIFILLVLISNVSFCANEKWTVACETDFPPYNYVDPEGRFVGLDMAIVNAVMEHIQVDLEVIKVPWDRVTKMLNRGDIDFAFQFVGVPSRFERYIMVGPFRHGKTVFAVKEDSKLRSYRDLRDLTNRAIGVVKGYSYTDEFDSAKYLDKIEHFDNQALLKRLLTGDVDLIIGDLMTLTFLAKQQDNYDQIRFLDRILRVVPRYIAFNKKVPNKAALFEEGLEAIRKNGTYDRIILEWQ